VSEPAGTEAQLEQEPLDDVDAAERLPAEIEPTILRKYFSLTRADLDEVERCRGSANQLGFSAQLCTLRAEGHTIDDAALALTTPLMHTHLNPFGRYQFDLTRMRQTVTATL
jgi:hypothetical protein